MSDNKEVTHGIVLVQRDQLYSECDLEVIDFMGFVKEPELHDYAMVYNEIKKLVELDPSFDSNEKNIIAVPATKEMIEHYRPFLTKD